MRLMRHMRHRQHDPMTDGRARHPAFGRVLATLLAAVMLGVMTAATPSSGQQATRVAVLDFSNGTPIDAERVEPLRRALGTTLAGALVRSGQVQVVERNRLRELLAEQDLASSGRVDDATAARIGKLLGVDYLFLGAFLVQPNGEMMVSTRLVNVATSTVTAGPEMVGDVKSATTLIAKLAESIAKQLRIPMEPLRSGARSTRDTPELSAALDALARACEMRDSARVAVKRTEIEKRAPGHPALGAPCY